MREDDSCDGEGCQDSASLHDKLWWPVHNIRFSEQYRGMVKNLREVTNSCE
jgi:hypothetical protein